MPCPFPRPSITCFPLMPKSQHYDGVFGWVMPVQRHVAGIAKVDHQLAPLGCFGERAPHGGRCLQQIKQSFSGLTSPARACGFSVARNWRQRSKPRAAPSVTITRDTRVCPLPRMSPTYSASRGPRLRQDVTLFPGGDPRRQSILFETLACFFAFHILLNRLEHDPVR